MNTSQVRVRRARWWVRLIGTIASVTWVAGCGPSGSGDVPDAGVDAPAEVADAADGGRPDVDASDGGGVDAGPDGALDGGEDTLVEDVLDGGPDDAADAADADEADAGGADTGVPPGAAARVRTLRIGFAAGQSAGGDRALRAAPRATPSVMHSERDQLRGGLQ